MYGFKPSDDEDLNISFIHNFEQMGVIGEEEMDPQLRVERQATLVREWGRFLQAHSHAVADGGLLKAVSKVLDCFLEWTLFVYCLCT